MSQPTTPSQPATPDPTSWYPVRRTFGPVTVERVGFAYLRPTGELAFLLDAGLAVGGLALTLDGLAVTVKLADPTAVPGFALRGLGVAYRSGDLAIDGAFQVDTIEYQGRSLTAYNGKAVLRTSAFTLGALGSYVQLPEGPSLFVYAFLDYPIGGPPIFFVQGLAAGFGYHRRLVPPPIADVPTFPLVAEAAGKSARSADLAGELRALRDYVPPSPGDFFVAVGVHFTSFRMIDSVVLLALGFGHRFELTVLGLSTLTLPSPDAASAGVNPLAQVQLALRATLVPDDGYFALRAQLTQNSYLLSPDCRLVGGFAFQAWFAPNKVTGEDHTGDFVVSAGGYHRRFAKPAHYPDVPRLGFSWQVSPQLAMKGSGYFALTPSALMAGGSFSATWNGDALKAWFNASMDFLIGWKPFHYEADLVVAIGASYTFSFFGTHTVRADVSATVSLWGPRFSAQARVDLGICSFTIQSVQDPKDRPNPIDWPRFQESFLPKPDTVVSVALAGGGAGAAGSGMPPSTDLGTVNPAELVLRTDSVIPGRDARRGPAGSDTALPAANAAFGIAPMGRATGTVASTHRIEIVRADGVPADALFVYQPVTKDLPAALWGTRVVPAITDPPLVRGLLTGYVVAPLPAKEPVAPPGLPRAVLAATTALDTQVGAIGWTPLAQFTPSPDAPDARRETIEQTITDPAVAAVRLAVAALFDPAEPAPDLIGFTVADLLAVPAVAQDGVTR